jgi:electron transfer flavoprotein beta subunit
VGEPAAEKTLRSALAMGAHRAILVKADRQFLDSTLTARALKAAIEKDAKPDLIFTGKGAVDTEGFQTLYRLAGAMNLPVVNEVTKFDLGDGKAVVEKEIGGGTREVLEMSVPCVVGATKGLNEPRYPKFPDIMKAKKKELKQMDLAELGVDPSGGCTELLNLEPVPERSGARMLEGDVRQKVVELVRVLKEEEKVLDG